MWISVRQVPALVGPAWRVSIGTLGACVIKAAGPKAHEPMNASLGRVTTANATACAAGRATACDAGRHASKDTAKSRACEEAEGNADRND
jgi:hypothetical protein